MVWMASQVGPQGKAYGIEHVPELVAFGRANMEKSSEGRQMLSEGRVVFVQGDGRLGLPVSSPAICLGHNHKRGPFSSADMWSWGRAWSRRFAPF